MKKSIILLCLFSASICFSQTEVEAIQKTLLNYINGSAYNDTQMIQAAFYKDADLFLSKEGQEIWRLTPKEYARLFENREKGKFNGREGKVLSIDYAENIASAKAEIKIPARDLLYMDIFLLKKLSGEWKIISKAATLIQQ